MLPSACFAVVTLLSSGPAEAAPTEIAAPGSEPAPPAVQAPAAIAEAKAEPPDTTPAASPSPSPAKERTASPATPSSPAPTEEATTPEPETEAQDEPSSATEGRAARTYPRLVIAGGPLIGPHAIGNEECKSEEARCETKGSFFGLGGQVELRGRLWRPLYLHVRGIAVRNVSPNDPIYGGMVGGASGLGLYGRRIFGRAEYMFVQALGDNAFEPPFFDGDVATDDWGNHAGMVAVGFRQPLPHHLSIELWGGVMFGPKSIRQVPQQLPDERVLTTFQLGVSLAWDAWR